MFSFLNSFRCERCEIRLCCSDIFWNVDQNRTRTSVLCSRECVADCLCELVDILYLIILLCDRFRDSLNVDFLERTFSQERFCDVAGNENNRGGIEE